MDHVEAAHADAAQMVLPFTWVLAHKLVQDREDGQGIKRQRLLLQHEIGSNIDVEERGLGWRRTRLVADGEGGQRRVGGVEGEGAGMVDGDVYCYGLAEVRRESAGRGQLC